MNRISLLFLLLCLSWSIQAQAQVLNNSVIQAQAQVLNNSVIQVGATPSGSCTQGEPSRQIPSGSGGTIYDCVAGSWSARGGGGGSAAGSSGDYQINNGGSFGAGVLAQSSGRLTATPTAQSSGVASYLRFITPADTGLTADTEALGIVFGGNASSATVTRTLADGTTLATQREYLFVAPTYAAAGATTLTNAIAVEAASPIAGTNITQTNSIAARFIASSAAHVPLVAKGAASQSGNLQNWVNSSDTVLSAMDSSGNLRVTVSDSAPAIVGLTATTTGYGISANNLAPFLYANGTAIARAGYAGTAAGIYTRSDAFYAWTTGALGSGADTGLNRLTTKVVGFTDGVLGTAAGGTFGAAATTPSQVTADQNNYNPGGSSLQQRWSTDASRNITGLTFTATQVSGQSHWIINVGSNNIVLKHQDASSTAANRFIGIAAADVTLAADEKALVQYDATTSRWRILFKQ